MKNRTLLFLALLLTISLTTSACTSVKDRFTGAQPTATPDEQGQVVTTEQTESSSKIVIELTAQNPAPGETAMDLLKNSGTKVEAKSYGDAGTFITSLNDLEGDAANYWAMYVNDEYAQEAADKTVIKNGDRVKFVYERISTTP